MHSATWKASFKNIRTILRTIDQCAKEVKEIHTAMLVSMFMFSIPCFLIKDVAADH
jgi:hypothetical protein